MIEKPYIKQACEEADCGEDEMAYVSADRRGAFSQAILALARRIKGAIAVLKGEE